MIGPVRGMAVITGIGHLMLVSRLFMALERRFVAGAAHVPLTAFEQALVIGRVGRMAGNAAVVFIAHQMIV